MVWIHFSSRSSVRVEINVFGVSKVLYSSATCSLRGSVCVCGSDREKNRVIKTEIWLCAPAQRWQSLPAGERGAQGEQVMKTGRLSSIRAPFLTKCSQHHSRILILLILLFLSCSLSLAYNNTQLHSFGRGENKRL